MIRHFSFLFSPVGRLNRISIIGKRKFIGLEVARGKLGRFQILGVLFCFKRQIVELGSDPTVPRLVVIKGRLVKHGGGQGCGRALVHVRKGKVEGHLNLN